MTRDRSKFSTRYAVGASTLALVVALTGVAAQATGLLVTGKQIKNGTISTKDLKNGGVRSADIGNGAVRSPDIGEGQVGSSDIGNGQVTSDDVSLPPPAQLQEAPGDTATAAVGTDFTLVDVVGNYGKQSSSSALEVQWTGTAAADFSPCVFQLRVDGQPSSASAGEVYVANGSALSVAVTSLFDGLSPGVHQIEVWARTINSGGTTYPCTVGPAFTGLGQTFVVSEIVI